MRRITIKDSFNRFEQFNVFPSHSSISVYFSNLFLIVGNLVATLIRFSLVLWPYSLFFLWKRLWIWRVNVSTEGGEKRGKNQDLALYLLVITSLATWNDVGNGGLIPSTCSDLWFPYILLLLLLLLLLSFCFVVSLIGALIQNEREKKTNAFFFFLFINTHLYRRLTFHCVLPDVRKRKDVKKKKNDRKWRWSIHCAVVVNSFLKQWFGSVVE